jgi:hypothetical protein
VVELFKRAETQTSKSTVPKHLLQRIEIEDRDDEIYVAEVRTKTQAANILGTKNVIDIEIDGWEVKHAGFFGKDYLVYDVFTTYLQTKVRRKLVDFTWLRESLIKNYPATYV